MLYNKLNGITKKKHFTVVLFFIYLFVALFLYRSTIGCRLVTDAQNWLTLYKDLGWSGLLNSFGENALHPGYHLFFFLSYKVFGTNELGWYLLFTSMHALNAFLIYYVFNKYLSLIDISDSKIVALSASFLFLVSPYQTETVVWGATIHYLLVTISTLLIINMVVLYHQNKRPLYLIVIPIVFCFALLCSELALCIPFVLVILFLFRKGDQKHATKRTIFLKIVTPIILTCVLYFCANKVLLGSWVGHYGASTHLKFSMDELISNFNKYIFKFLFFGNFLVGFLKENTVGGLDSRSTIYYAIILYFSVIAFYGANTKFRRAINKSLLLFLCFGAALLPILNLFFNTLPIEGDRLGYLASAFFFGSFSVFLFSLNKNISIIIVLVFSVISLFLLNKNITSWKNAAAVQIALETNFRWENADRVYLLTVPDNFNGAYLYRDNGTLSKFKTALNLKHEQNIKGDFYEVLQFNMTELENSVTVEIIDSLTLKVTFDQWGNWWWRGGIGASDYENDLYKVEIDEWSHAYIVTFKQKRPEDVFIYQKGISWQQVNGF